LRGGHKSPSGKNGESGFYSRYGWAWFGFLWLIPKEILSLSKTLPVRSYSVKRDFY